MREIVLDTETTGLDPQQGHRLVEIGCVEVVNYVATGQTFHIYLNPDRTMPMEAQQIHGLSDEFLADKPRFTEVAQAFIDFIGDSPLVIHNAGFDMKFLNAELALAGLPTLEMARAIDTVIMARRKFPGQPASLDALCRRFGVDNSARDYHGALLDAQLLAEVYLELRGGRQPNLIAAETTTTARATVATTGHRPYRAPRPHAPTDDELAAHRAFIATIKNALWDNVVDAKSA
jgi:DNA polymerase-3 subunit epsilon